MQEPAAKTARIKMYTIDLVVTLGDFEASDPAMADAGKQPLWPGGHDSMINTDGDDGSHLWRWETKDLQVGR